MKKVLSIVLSLVMVLCMMPAMAFADTAAVYSDIAGTPCEDAVTTLSGLGVVKGYPDGTYQPDVAVKRAEAAKLIVAALGLEDEAAGTTASFTDLAGYDWAEGYIGYAESLGILKGDGNGHYRPGDVVSYNEMAAIVIRALGYTDEALQGSFPAAHVAKAKALGAFNDVVSGGSAGADRGDCAIMIANILGQPIGATDKDGQWTANTPADSMIKRLGATANSVDGNGNHVTEVVTLTQAQNATTDLYPFIGASAYLYKNAKNKIVAVGEVESTFLTGKFTDSNKFKVDDVTYTLDDTSATYTTNWGTVDTDYDSISELVAAEKEATIAVKVSGKKITDLYSINTWVGTSDQLVAADITKLEKTDKLLNNAFPMNDSNEIDTTKFDIVGADSLADLKVDDVVTIYMAGPEIVKIEVCDDVVTGVITKIAGGKYTVNGTPYEPMTGYVMPVVAAGNEVTLTLTYAGTIFECEAVAATSNYAIVMNAESGHVASAGAIDGKDAKVVLFTAEGSETKYVVDIEEVTDFAADADVTEYVGKLVKFAVKNDKIVTLDIVKTNTARNTDTKITKAGYLNSKEISNDVVVFTTDKAITREADKSLLVNGGSVLKAENLGTSTKSALLGLDLGAQYVSAFVSNDKNEIVAIIIPATVANDDAVYGIVTSDVYKIEKAGKEVSVIDLFVGSTTMTAVEYSGDTPTKGAMFEVKTKTDGSVVLESTLADLNKATISVAAEDYITIKTSNGTDKIIFSDADVNEGTEVNKGQLDAKVVVYVQDADGVITVGDASDLEIAGTAKTVETYTCKTATHDEFGLIAYVIVK